MDASKIVINKFGAANSLDFEKFQLNEDLAADEVLVEVRYSGVNFADIVMRLGFYRDAPPKPFVPGYEVSGYVKSLGTNVTGFEVGDKIVAGTRFNGYSSHLKLHKNQLVKLPSDSDLKKWAAKPVNFITAHIALDEFGRVRPGDKILLDCATGGVGVMAMQLAKNAGADVVGLTTTPSKKEFIEQYGAKAYTHEEFYKSEEYEFDFVLNSSAGLALDLQYKRLAKAGKLCCIGVQSAIHNGSANYFKLLKTVLTMPKFGVIKNITESKMVGGFNALKFFEDEAWLRKNLQILASSELEPHIGGVFNAKEVADAHRALELKQVRGKVLLEWQH